MPPWLGLFVPLPVKFLARRTGFMWGRLAACGRVVLGPASEARLRARRSGPRGPECPARLGCGSAALWGRLAACGRLRVPCGRGPASWSRLRARRSGSRQPGISRAVGLRLCCSVGQAGSLRPIAGALWARRCELVSPARETIRPRQPGISRAVGLRLRCSAGQVVNLQPRPEHPQSARRAQFARAAGQPVWAAPCNHPKAGYQPAAGCQPALQSHDL